MSESIFTSIMEEWVDSKWESYADAPEFNTSKKHDRAMKRIFRRYERNTQHLRSASGSEYDEQKMRPMPKRLLMILVIILLALIAGCSAIYATRTLYVELPRRGVTKVWLLHRENNPAFIEKLYYLPELPDGFEITEKRIYPDDSRPITIEVIYENKQTAQRIQFTQRVRNEDRPTRFYTKDHKLIEVDINGYIGVYNDMTDGIQIASNIYWDDGDYIIDLTGEMSKNDLLNLAKSAKLSEIPIVSN